MEYDALVRLTGALPCFDWALLAQVAEEKRESLRVQLSRWIKHGKVIPLRRGMYTLPDVYRRAAVSSAFLANQLYRPSYLSGLWALGYYDLIPERVVVLTSVATRVPRRFENSFGVFEYRRIKQAAFFGYKAIDHGSQPVLVAEPAKALLDHWHLTTGEWTEARLAEMRYQHHEVVEAARLRDCAERFGSARLRRAAERWLALAQDAEKGTVTL